MPSIRVNVDILNKGKGQEVYEDDKNYSTFEAWAKRKDRMGGFVIAEFIQEKTIEAKKEEEQKAPGSDSAEGAGDAEAKHAEGPGSDKKTKKKNQ